MSNLTLDHIEPIAVCLQGKLQLEPLIFYKTASSAGSSNLQVLNCSRKIQTCHANRVRPNKKKTGNQYDFMMI